MTVIMFWNLHESSVTLDGCVIDYAVFGKGTTPLVIIPGLSLRDVRGAGAGLALMYRMFARDYRVYFIDKAADIPDGCTVADLARDTADAMRALGIADACVIGVSLGGMIAQEIAVCAPNLVKKLVLGVTASRTNDTMRAVVGHWIDLAESGDFGGIVRDMLSVMYSEDYVRRYGWLFSLLAPFVKPKNEVRFLRLAKACLSCDVYDRLDRITSPTLVLGGADDQIVTGAASLEIAERCGCTVHLYDGLGHAAYEEAADFNARIYDFLQKSAEING